MKRGSSILVLLLLLACCFCLAAILQPRAAEWTSRGQSGGVLKLVFGEGRRLFANHFFKEADVYLHSGYYPSIFDAVTPPKDSQYMTEAEGEHEGEDDGEHEKCELDFMRPPKDWVEAFGRHFSITEHTHLSNGKEREILPWLRLSADMDPQRIDTYVVAGFWLANLGQVKEAETFLREGLQNNPDSYEILFELARLYEEKEHDLLRARNLCARALKCWEAREAGKKEADLIGYEKIAFRLGRLEEETGQLEQAVEHFRMAQKVSPSRNEIEKEIQKVQAQLRASKPGS